jgi:hypothetical protein
VKEKQRRPSPQRSHAARDKADSAAHVGGAAHAGCHGTRAAGNRQRGGGSCPTSARSEVSGSVTVALGRAQFGAQSFFYCSKITQILQFKYATIPKSKNVKT